MAYKQPGDWVNQSPFIRRMLKAWGIKNLRLKIKDNWSMGKVKGRHDCRKGVHYIYVTEDVRDYRNIIIHEIVHALRNHTNTESPILPDSSEYDYDWEEYEALVWEIRYMVSIGLTKIQALDKMYRQSRYPREFWEVLWLYAKE